MSEKKPLNSKGKNPSVPVSSLAKLFNLTSVRIQQLASDGIVIRTSRGRYDLWSSISNYIEYLQERRVNQWDDESENPTELKKQQLRRTKEEADKLELANAKTRGELIEKSEVIKAGEEIMAIVRNAILNDKITEEAKDKCLKNLLRLKSKLNEI